MELGPFHGHNTEYQRYSIPFTDNILTSEYEVAVLKALAQCKVLARNQISELIGLNIKNAVANLCKKGFLDEYKSETAPPLYALGHAGAQVMKEVYVTYKTGELLRLAAANHLWLKMSKLWPNASWNVSGDYPCINKDPSKFLVIAPRLSQSDQVYTLRAFNYISNNTRLIIVAASQDQALEVAHQSIPTDFVRYTWDALLKDKIEFYRFDKHNFVKDFEFKPETQHKKALTQPPQRVYSITNHQ